MRRFVASAAALVLSCACVQPASATRYKRDYRFLGSKGGEDAKRKTTMERRAEPKGSVWVAALPLGAGQFQEGSYGLGLTFAALQVGGLYTYYSANQEADRSVAQTDAYLRQRNQDNAGGSESEEDQRATREFADQRLKYANEQNRRASQGLMIFAGSWLVSSTLAIWNLQDSPVNVGFVRTPSGELASGLVAGWRL